MFFAIFVY